MNNELCLWIHVEYEKSAKKDASLLRKQYHWNQTCKNIIDGNFRFSLLQAKNNEYSESQFVLAE